MSLTNAVVDSALFFPQNISTNIFNNFQNKEVIKNYFGDYCHINTSSFDRKANYYKSFIDSIAIQELPRQEKKYSDSDDAMDTKQMYPRAKSVIPNINNTDARERVFLEKYGFNLVDNLRNESESFANYARSQSSTELDRTIAASDRQTTQVNRVSPSINPAFELIGLTKLRNNHKFSNIDGSGFNVAVIDTGIDLEHPLLASNYVAGYDFVDDDDDPTDPNGHGTHVSGIIAATDETIGVAPDAGLIGLRSINSNGSGSMSVVEDALEWVFANRTKHNITVINLSLGTGFYSSEFQVRGNRLIDDIQRLEDAGITVVSATGNNYFTQSNTSHRANISFPGISSTLAVGAVWQKEIDSTAVWHGGSIDYSTGADRIASFSQRLDAPNVVFAPGTAIASTLPGGTIGESSGTSQATPHVAGAVTLLQEASLQFSGDLLSPEEIAEILRTTGDVVIDGDDEDDNVINTNGSYTRINIYNAVLEIKRRSNNITPPAENNPGMSIPTDSNDTIANAVALPILAGSPIDSIQETIGRDGSNIRHNDVDFYSLQLESWGRVSIETAERANSGNFDSHLRLFDASGSELAFNDDIDSTNLFSRLDLSLYPGKYYVGVSGYNNTNYDPKVAGSGIVGDTGNYALNLSFEESDFDETLLGATVHRFYRADIGVHFYTASVTERDAIDNSLANYVYEGESYTSAADTHPITGAKPVYRFLNQNTGVHLYTMSEIERETIDRNLSNYSFEGIAYYGYESDRPEATPLYRFYNSVLDTHFYTPSVNERDTVLANLPDYQLEGNDGIAFYVEPAIEV